MVSQGLYNASTVPQAMEAQDDYDSQEAFKLAYVSVMKYYKLIGDAGLFKTHEERLQFEADLINYVVDKRQSDSKDEGYNKKVSLWGDHILKEQNLNMKKESHRSLKNKTWETYKKVAGG